VLVGGGVRDRGYVFIDGSGPVGILDRMSKISEMPLSIEPGQTLQIVVESMGRICFGPGINDFKGIVSNVTLNGITLLDWEMTLLPLKRKLLPKPQRKPPSKATVIYI